MKRDKKDKNEVIKEINELTKEKEYIKELNEKEQKLANNNKIINDLEYQIKLLKDKENDELKNVIKKNNEAKIKISDKIKMYEDSSMPTKIPQSVRKRDNKVKTFAPKDSKIDSSLKDFKKDSLPKYNEKLNRLKNLEEEYQNITEEKYISNPNKISDIE